MRFKIGNRVSGMSSFSKKSVLFGSRFTNSPSKLGLKRKKNDYTTQNLRIFIHFLENYNPGLQRPTYQKTCFDPEFEKSKVFLENCEDLLLLAVCS